MTITGVGGVGRPEAISICDRSEPAAVLEPRDLQRTFRLVLATVWLLDAVLQIQPFMFTPGANGFSGMLNGMAAGNPELDRPHHHLERLDHQSPARPDRRALCSVFSS